MAEDITALRRATNAKEICRILAQIGDNIQDMVSRDQYISLGLVENLRGRYSDLFYYFSYFLP